MKKLLILTLFFGVFFIVGCSSKTEAPKVQPKDNQSSVVCTQEAKLCPDGSSVSRTGPNCEFAPCPKEEPAVSATKTKTIKLYYYNPNKDKDESGNIKCSREGLVAVEREIPISITPIQDTINLLLSGKLTNEEQTQGISTEYPLEGFLLKGASLEEGVLTFEFNDPQNKTIGGSCRISILWSQIEATAKQFPEVKSVRFLPEELFQP